MKLYTESGAESILWPEPMERVYQCLPGGPSTVLASKMPHVSLSEALFIGAVSALPGEQRPWGAITWLSEVFDISRVSVYALGERLKEQFGGSKARVAVVKQPVAVAGEPRIVVTEKRIARTVLTATFPGAVAIRPTQALLQEALEQTRSIGWISELRVAAGRRAGELLQKIDTSALGPLIAIRDETFFQGQPILLVLDPVSLTILLAEVCPDRQAETWGIALLLAQAQGAKITGLVEDMARFYPKSQQLAEMDDVAVQKDPWHLQRAGGQVRLTLEKAAYRAMNSVAKLEKQLRKGWDESVFTQKYIPAVADEERLLAQHDRFAEWLGHLHDAFELVDLRSGEIRDPATATWFLQEILTALTQIEQAQVQAFVKTLRTHQAHLLTFLDWAAAALLDYRSALAHHFPQPATQHHFERTVARHWRLRQALINGQPPSQRTATQARTDFLALSHADPASELLANRLLRILDGAGHTSSLVECVNSLLKRFLSSRQAFRNPLTLQAYLNLFVLWHNMHTFARGKRTGQSPYQLAGIDPGATDWLELLGYSR